MLDDDVPRLLGVSPPSRNGGDRHSSPAPYTASDLFRGGADQLVILPPEVQAAIDQVQCSHRKKNFP
jgi:hypothetical protein